MNIIKKVDFALEGKKTTILEITAANNVVLEMPYTNNESYSKNHINVTTTREENNKFDFKRYNSFEKSEILKIREILLNAYVFSHDKLDDAVKEELCIDQLFKLKKLVLAVRTHLRYVSKYLIEYEEMKKEVVKDL